jgi:hypothetical protein
MTQEASFMVKFSIEDYFTEHTNNTTNLKWKRFTKVIKMPSKGAWAWIDIKFN